MQARGASYGNQTWCVTIDAAVWMKGLLPAVTTRCLLGHDRVLPHWNLVAVVVISALRLGPFLVRLLLVLDLARGALTGLLLVDLGEDQL